jgi:hypothetical protein
MAHHKRGRARGRRAGCKLCKPWKANGHRTERPDGERFADHRRRQAAAGALREMPGAAG